MAQLNRNETPISKITYVIDRWLKMRAASMSPNWRNRTSFGWRKNSKNEKSENLQTFYLLQQDCTCPAKIGREQALKLFACMA